VANNSGPLEIADAQNRFEGLGDANTAKVDSEMGILTLSNEHEQGERRVRRLKPVVSIAFASYANQNSDVGWNSARRRQPAGHTFYETDNRKAV
jgi:hypothetical protein